MKLLNGSDLASFIKERQSKQVRGLVQGEGIQPKLAIIQTIDDPVINTYVRLKKKYGEDIGIEVEVHFIDAAEAQTVIAKLNGDESVSGIIVQLPLSDDSQQEEILNSVDANKDVDGLALESRFEPATPVAIEWLLNGYNVELKNKKIAIVGKGRLVGAPLLNKFEELGYEVDAFDKSSEYKLPELLHKADVVISGAGSPGLITSDMLKHGAVAVDAGVAVESGQNVGDFSEGVYLRDDIKITPRRGGVGPLTVSALFENVIRAVQT